jgi:DnaD/phage-associated family protein
MQGWIKLHRKLLASDVFQNEKLLKVFIYCLLKATHSEISQKVGRQTVELKPGQFIYGRKKAALELNMKESTVRDYINILKDDGVITVNPTNKYSIITVVNWDLYQSKEETPDNKYDSTSDNKPTTEGQQKDTNKNVKNIEDEEETNPVALYERNFFPLTPMQIESIWDWVDDFKGNQEVICMAIKETALKNPSSPFKYLTRILVDWHKRKLFTLEDVLKAKEQYEKSKVIHLERKKQKQEQPQGRYIPKDAVVDINAGEDPNWTWKKPF